MFIFKNSTIILSLDVTFFEIGKLRLRGYAFLFSVCHPVLEKPGFLELLHLFLSPLKSLVYVLLIKLRLQLILV